MDTNSQSSGTPSTIAIVASFLLPNQDILTVDLFLQDAEAALISALNKHFSSTLWYSGAIGQQTLFGEVELHLTISNDADTFQEMAKKAAETWVTT